MEDAEHNSQLAVGHQLIVKADEIDQDGTAIQSPSKQLPLSALDQRDGAAPATNRTIQAKSTRPILRREGSAPPPPSQPPPPAPPMQQNPDNVTDSLSLPQLKQLVSQFPKVEQRAYAFQYADAQSFADEIEEWFQYSEQDGAMISSAKETFEQKWKSFSEAHRGLAQADSSWINVSDDVRRNILLSVVSSLNSPDRLTRLESLEVIFYILGGVWATTAGLERHGDDGVKLSDDEDSDEQGNSVQLEWMHVGADLLVECSGLQMLQDCMKKLFAEDNDESLSTSNAAREVDGDAPETLEEYNIREQVLLLTCWYFFVESARHRADSEAGKSMRNAMLRLESNFLVSCVDVLAQQRWEDISSISSITRASRPLESLCFSNESKLLLLFWKSILLLFGDTEEALQYAKTVLQAKVDRSSTDVSHPVLTASPLEYHLFRQEITSKYPAYNPPLPLVPFEAEHKSILPPLPHHPSRANPVAGSTPGFGQPDGIVSGSILHQPVHIATPAPSPPPSPVGPGGKAGKKQNFQTNQNFPFLYPPLDGSSNNIGGKGTTEFQDLRVGKKWEGSDIPASIIEAGQLFANRMRMTRAMRQLWREREHFLKDDRGWEGKAATSEDGKSNPDHESDWKEPIKAAREDGENEAALEDLESRLSAVEDFYHFALPNLQSLVIVMMKTMLFNVQNIALQNGSIGDGGQTNGLPRTKSNLNVQQANTSPNPPAPPQTSELSMEELNETRLREICHKAISGSLFLLLKWFKISHVLKFEYLTQLLLDSNYIPLVLKFFAHQNLEDLVAIRYDRDDLGFFHFCHLNSDHPPLSPTSPASESSPASSPDEAIPPPILRHRRSPTSDSTAHHPSQQTVASPDKIDETPNLNDVDNNNNNNPSTPPPRPSVDELGNPLAPIPQTPITTFSFRQFQTSIHLLRILQKISRHKSHRILLLVQYKSSQILRRILRVPDPLLRLYVLKLFKSQVPYCGRKWRQSNMKVITAIYLHCRPELRDEWLAGMHDQSVEGEVDEALPLEWALRGLTFWWIKRRYGDVVKDAVGEAGIEDGEKDFFQRELDLMGWGVAAMGVGGAGAAAGAGGAENGDVVAFGEEAVGAPNGDGNGNAVTQNGEQWEQGGPLQMEGW